MDWHPQSTHDLRPPATVGMDLYGYSGLEAVHALLWAVWAVRRECQGPPAPLSEDGAYEAVRQSTAHLIPPIVPTVQLLPKLMRRHSDVARVTLLTLLTRNTKKPSEPQNIYQMALLDDLNDLSTIEDCARVCFESSMLPRKWYSLHEIECRLRQGAKVVLTLILHKMRLSRDDFCTK